MNLQPNLMNLLLRRGSCKGRDLPLLPAGGLAGKTEQILLQVQQRRRLLKTMPGVRDHLTSPLQFHQPTAFLLLRTRDQKDILTALTLYFPCKPA